MEFGSFHIAEGNHLSPWDSSPVMHAFIKTWEILPDCNSQLSAMKLLFVICCECSAASVVEVVVVGVVKKEAKRVFRVTSGRKSVRGLGEPSTSASRSPESRGQVNRSARARIHTRAPRGRRRCMRGSLSGRLGSTHMLAGFAGTQISVRSTRVLARISASIDVYVRMGIESNHVARISFAPTHAHSRKSSSGNVTKIGQDR